MLNLSDFDFENIVTPVPADIPSGYMSCRIETNKLIDRIHEKTGMKKIKIIQAAHKLFFT